MDQRPLHGPPVEDTPGAWPETPADLSTVAQPDPLEAAQPGASSSMPLPNAYDPASRDMSQPSADRTAVPSPAESQDATSADQLTTAGALSIPVEPSASSESSMAEAKTESFKAYEPIKPTRTTDSAARGPSTLQRIPTATQPTEEKLFQALSQRRTNLSGRKDSIVGDGSMDDDEQAEIKRLMSRMFGKSRQAHSEEEQTRHTGVAFRNVTVKGMGLGAALQPSVGDILLGLPRLLKGLFSKGPKKSGKPPIRTILNDFSGCVKPGEMLLVLGRPGSGCSTFLKVLGNQRFGYEEVSGEVSYGGASAQEMMKNYRGEVLYNPEDDIHYATLSVKNTLTFALTTRTPGKDSRAEGESRAEYVREFLRVVAKLFWIEHTMNTKIGNEIIRGVSGGEKKRVSIAEAMITKASTQCWDNSTRGLDSSTALEYVQSLRTLTNMVHVSTLVALYQAGESLYELFDKVLLIHEGRCAYFGPTEDAKAYFEGLGFAKRDRWTTADFITSVTDQHERDVRPGWEDRIPRTAQEFEQAYKRSTVFGNNLKDIEELESEFEQQRKAREEHAMKRKNYTIPFYKQVLACTRRQFLVMLGDRLSLLGKWGGIVFQSLIVGSLFFDMPQNSSGVFPRGGVLFFMLLFNALLALAELTSAFSSRPIMLKHKSFSFYRPAAFAIAQVVLDVPLVIIQVLIFDTIVYWMTNLRPTASAFFISLLILFVSTMTMYSFFRAIGSISRSLDTATRITGVSIQALITYTGYLIPPRKMRPWLKWLIWINPIQYAFEALVSNEFTGLDIQCVPPFVVPQGPGAEPQYQSCTIQGSRPGQLIVNGADYIRVGYNYSRSHLWRNIGIIIAFWLLFVILTMIGMERQKPNRGGGAVTVYKRGQVPKKVEEAIVVGAPAHDEEMGEKGAAGKLEHSSDSDSDSARAEGVAKNETVFTWSNVNYTIPYEKGQRKLLQDVQGYVRPGRLTALMGASGAGKTTLLNTLAQRINFGVVTGDFLVDGRPLPKSFQRATGFAEQMDIHERTATVREALRFSALLRQPKEVSQEEKFDYVERVIRLLEMEEIAGAAIGDIGAGLNQEQRKRVTIGVELAAKPKLLMFLDEPTSGLDSAAAFNIVRFLRKLADAGQAILCTIHQPSAVLFEYFDELLLLKSGGRVVYHGPLGKDSRTLIEYFERNGAKSCPPNANPAEYMLDAIGAGNPDYKGKDWGDVWAASPEHEERGQEIRDMIESRHQVASVTGTAEEQREFAMPLTTQIAAVVRRSYVSYWRDPDYIVGKFVLHVFTGLFNTFTFFKLGKSAIDMQCRLFSVFMTLTISPPLIQQLQPKFLGFREIYRSREANAKIYSWIALVIGAILVEIPYNVIAGTLYFNCWYWGVGFPRKSSAAGYTWMMLMAFEIYYPTFGQAIASFAPNELLASLLVPVFFLFVVSFCGVVVPAAQLPKFWRAWMYPLTPFRYLVEGFVGTVVHGVPVVCDESEFARFPPPPGQTCQQYTRDFIQRSGGYVEDRDGMCRFCQFSSGDEFGAAFNVFYRYRWRDFGIFLGYCLFNIAVIFVCSWLFLGGMRKIRARLGPSARKQAKAA